MDEELKNILSNLNNEVKQEKLLEYLNKHMSAGDAHEVEKQMLDDEMLDDAVEGLAGFKNKADLPYYVEQLNRDLKKQLDKKRARKEKRRWKDKPWIYIAILLILGLLVVCFIVLKKNLEQRSQRTELLIKN